jgi:hypothetical protein
MTKLLSSAIKSELIIFLILDSEIATIHIYSFYCIEHLLIGV